MRDGETPSEHVTLSSYELDSLDKDVWEEFGEIRDNCDISDIDIHNI
jgi:hypothetical protein